MSRYSSRVTVVLSSLNISVGTSMPKVISSKGNAAQTGKNLSLCLQAQLSLSLGTVLEV